MNSTGSFLLGAFVAVTTTAWPVPPELRLLFDIGLLGAFTTVSTFAMDVAYLHGRHRSPAASLYVVASVTLSLTGAILGYHLANAILG